MHRPRILSALLSAAALASGIAATPAPALAQHYLQTNLTADQSGAPVIDRNLVNPWGLSRATGSPWWVSDNGTGLSTLYDGSGNTQPLVVVTIPPADPSKSHSGSPTGTIFNGTTGFELAPKKPAVFLFCTEDGTISGWNPQVQATTAVIKVNRKNRSAFTGLTMASIDVPNANPISLLYAADFKRGRVQIYDSYFRRIPQFEDAFRDRRIPHGYSPFNVQNIGGNIYVTYAKQSAGDPADEVHGKGLGFVDVYSPIGRLLLRLEHGPWFNAPWGIVQASGDFGIYTHDILVGQLGSGEIFAFNPVSGRLEGRLRDAKNKPIANPGLWALSFGSGVGKSGPANTLYITAGTHDEQGGLLAAITAVENTQGNDQ